MKCLHDHTKFVCAVCHKIAVENWSYPVLRLGFYRLRGEVPFWRRITVPRTFA